MTDDSHTDELPDGDVDADGLRGPRDGRADDVRPDQQTLLWWLRVTETASTQAAVDEMTRRFDATAYEIDAALRNVDATVEELDETTRLRLAIFLEARMNAVNARAAARDASRRGDHAGATSWRLAAERHEETAADKRRILAIEDLAIVDGGGSLPTTPQRE